MILVFVIVKQHNIILFSTLYRLVIVFKVVFVIYCLRICLYKRRNSTGIKLLFIGVMKQIEADRNDEK